MLSISLFEADNFLESFIELNNSNCCIITAPATTGPAQEPLPTSSIPTIILLIYFFSIEKSAIYPPDELELTFYISFPGELFATT